jgi:hypothetical protein
MCCHIAAQSQGGRRWTKLRLKLVVYEALRY